MSDAIDVQTINFDELQRAMDQAPGYVYKFGRSEMGRFGNRTRKKFIRTTLKGSPLNWNERKKKIGRNVRAELGGTDLNSLSLTTAISKILRKHDRNDPQHGEIRPSSTGVQALAIPTRDGLPYKPRVVPGIFKVPGSPLLAVKTGDGRLKVLYVLARKVRIKPKFDFLSYISRESSSDLRPHLSSAAVRAMKKAIDDNLKAFSSGASSFGNTLGGLS